jgi:hypothetical protein
MLSTCALVLGILNEPFKTAQWLPLQATEAIVCLHPLALIIHSRNIGNADVNPVCTLEPVLSFNTQVGLYRFPIFTLRIYVDFVLQISPEAKNLDESPPRTSDSAPQAPQTTCRHRYSAPVLSGLVRTAVIVQVHPFGDDVLPERMHYEYFRSKSRL